MAVNLFKETNLPEYTPVHLIDEQETMPKISTKDVIEHGEPDEHVSIEVVNTTEEKQLAETMNTILAEIQNADVETQMKFCSDFIPAANRIKKCLKRKKKTGLIFDGEIMIRVIPKLLISFALLTVVLNKNVVIEFFRTNCGSYSSFLSSMFTALSVVLILIAAFLWASAFFIMIRKVMGRPLD